tara:strand:+ start:1744 stop:2283 length:540 start_codon:yes stop_codon:yes gene_type:complete
MKKYAVTENGVIIKVINSDANPVPSNYIDMTTNEPHHMTTDEAQAAYDLFTSVSYFKGVTDTDILNKEKIIYDSSIPMVWHYSIHRAGENFKGTEYTLDVDAVSIACVTGDNSGTAHTEATINLMNWFRDSWNIPITLCEPPKSNVLVQAWCKNSLGFTDTGTLYNIEGYEFYIYRRTN